MSTNDAYLEGYTYYEKCQALDYAPPMVGYQGDGQAGITHMNNKQADVIKSLQLPWYDPSDPSSTIC